MTVKHFFRIFFFIAMIAALAPVTAKAQLDYSNTKVDQLSDAQIRDMMKKMKEMGYSEAQMEKVAKARGMSDAEIIKLKERVSKIEAEKPSETEIEQPLKEEEIENTGRKINNPNRKKPAATDSAKVKSRIFGADLFSSDNLTFEPNMRMATPKGYVIGPDDQLLLDLTGDNEASYKLTVSPEGYISLEYIGRIAVGGLTIEQATGKIRAAMQRTYPALAAGRSQIALNLGNIRSISVIINGEVRKPGSYTLPSLASVFNALYAAGGPSERGSFRNIQLIRNNRTVATIDLYDFLVNGTLPDNIRLEDQDVIHVPVYEIRVDVLGEVKRSAIYELRADESLVELLRYTGGFSDMAYKSRVKIFQNTATARKVISKSLIEFPDYKPKNGDVVFVDPILERFENRVQVIGSVFRPGVYELTPGLTLRSLIQQADGLTEEAFKSRGYITRLNADNTSSVLSFDVAKIIENTAADIDLKREDIVQIFSILDLRDEYNVSIGGQVRKPGVFPYASNMSVEDLIQMAGGFKEGANPANIEVSRRIASADLTKLSAPTAKVFNIKVNADLSLSNAGFILEPHDIVSVRQAEGYTPQQQVQITGEVLHPGIYTITAKNERISDVLKRAGGLTAYAYIEGASLKRQLTAADSLEAKEEQVRVINRERLRQTGARDSLQDEQLESVRAADLVGIQLAKILKSPDSRYNLILEDGDIIKVPSLLQTVKVSGEVLRPINVVYKPGKSLKYYVNNAGGFSNHAFKRGTFVSNANGAVAGTRNFFFIKDYPKMTPGAEVSVPRRAERERLNAQGWVGIGTAVASIAALLITIIR